MSFKSQKSTNGSSPVDSSEYMNGVQVEYFKQKLNKWKLELIEESQVTVDHLKQENWNESDINDRASVETETSLELRTRDRYRKLLSKIDDALGRIDDGSYGFCEETGEPIGVKRLEARPIATLSIEAQERHERFEKSHSDE
jgi:DnaK suppressor protein